MILGEKFLRERVGDDIGIEPIPNDDQIQPNSIDVRMSNELWDSATDEIDYKSSNTLQPGRFYLSCSIEKLDLPSSLCAMLTGRSSVGRRGIGVHITAGFVDSGFSGELTFEMYNFGLKPVSLRATDRIAQLVFFETKGATLYDGKYDGQTGVQKSIPDK